MTTETHNEALNEIEVRAVDVNSKLLQVIAALRSGNTDSALSLVQVAQSMQWENRRALLALGAMNSVTGGQTVGAEYLAEDELFPDVDSLDLSKLKLELQ